MKGNTVICLVLFNLIFALAGIVLFSVLRDSGAGVLVTLLAVVLSLCLFVGVNYALLALSGRKKPVRKDKLKDEEDYRQALESWIDRKNPFNQELQQAIHQLDLFYQKKTALKALLGEDAKEGNPFMTVSSDVRVCLFANMKKVLNRMTIADMSDTARIPEHRAYLRRVLEQNGQLLNQYDNLIIEISQIGDSRDFDKLDLDSITEALRRLRDDSGEDEAASPALQEGISS